MSNLSKKNSKSQLLSNEENQFVFNVLGKGCFTLATGVAQLFCVRCHRNRHRWVKQCCGVVCFVKDNPKKSYYIRLYDVQNQQMLWEQEIYTKFIYNTPKQFFHTFEADDCHVGLNFASEDEAVNFSNVVESKLLGKKSKRQKPVTDSANTATINDLPEVTEKETSPNSPPVVMRNKKNKRKKKLAKDDVGGPLNFVHVSHMSWGVTDGPHMDRLDEDMKALLKQIGIIERSEVDNDTMDFICDFVDRHGGVNAVREDFAWHVPAEPSHPGTEISNAAKHSAVSEPHKASIKKRPLPALPKETVAEKPVTSKEVKFKVSTPVTNPQDLQGQSLHRNTSTSAALPKSSTSSKPPPNIKPKPSSSSHHPATLPKPPLPNRTPTSTQQTTKLLPSTATTNTPSVISKNNQNNPETVLKASNFNSSNASAETLFLLPTPYTPASSPIQDASPPSTFASTKISSPGFETQTASPGNTIITQSPSTTAKRKDMSIVFDIPPSPSPPPPPPPAEHIPPPSTFSSPPSPPYSSDLPTHFPPPIQLQRSAENIIQQENKSSTGLLNEIEDFEGNHLKHVKTNDHPSDRDGLLTQIRRGTILKHVNIEENPMSAKRGSIAAALMDQLMKRKTVVQFSDNEYSSDEFDDDWDDE